MDKKASPEALYQMKRSSARWPNTQWAAYENQALDSATLGHLQFLAVGPDNTYQQPPKAFPDTRYGVGWKYQFVGWVSLNTGEISEVECA